jgi:type IV pilus assembly protein PilC
LIKRRESVPIFVYEGRDAKGDAIGGTVEARSRAAVMAMLRPRGYVVTSVKEKRETAGLGALLGVKRKVRNRDLTLFSRQFATMVNAGLALLQSLDILSNQTESPVLRNTLRVVRTDVEAGLPLSQALGKHPNVFSRLYVDLVRAGETGGVLDVILLRLATYLEKMETLRRKVKTAMAYPLTVISVAILITFGLITFGIPVFAKLYEGFGAELPLPTRMLIALSGFLRQFLLVVAAVVAGAIILFQRWRSTQSGARRFDAFILRLPIVGGLLLKTAIARFTRTFGILLSSGVPVLEALEVVAQTAGNKVIEAATLKARAGIKEGETIAAPLERTAVFPPMVTQMIAVGEETGELSDMLIKIADFYDEEVDTAVAALTSMVEPLLMVFIGVVIGFIVIAMYLPLFNLPQLMSGRM